MKKGLLLLLFLMVAFALSAVYQVGDTVDDFGWTDNLGDDHTIYELIDSGKAIVFFWGGTG